MTFYGHNADVNCVKWFPNNITFASGGDDGYIRLFDIRSCRQLNVYKTEDRDVSVMSLGFSQSGKYLFCGYDERPYCQVFNTITGKAATTLLHTDRVTAIELPLDGNSIITASWDTFARIWA